MRGLLAGLLALSILGTGAAAAYAAQPGPDAPAWNRTPVVGLQVGHWYAQQLPDEQADLRDNSGAVWNGYREVDTNYAVAEGAASLLRAEGVKVDVLPATVPPGYRADAFVAVHADQDVYGQARRGWKIAPSALTRAPDDSQRLADDIGGDYAAATELPPDLRPGAVTPDMRLYFAFNWRYYQHAIAPRTPAAIIELGFITDEGDRQVLFDRPGVAAQGLASGVLQFLAEEPRLASVQV